MVVDVDAAVDSSPRHLGFTVRMNAAPAFADADAGRRGAGTGRLEPDPPHRDDIAAEVERLRGAGAPFRNDIVTGPGGQQSLLEDSSGHVVELFQPADG